MTVPTDPHLEVLHVPDCPNLAPMLDRLREVTETPVHTREITTQEDAARYGMPGSPTLLIDGVDPFAAPGPCECAIACRLYHDETGRPVPAPSTAQLREALTKTADQVMTCETGAGDELSAWRTRALPLEPVERQVHQAILRGFASTGHPPSRDELAPLTDRTGRSTAEVLAALHEIDAIRLSPGGDIAVAYPFSAAPTRHRVRLDNGIEVHAMCAVDALGMSAMLGMDTEIDSADATTGNPVTITMTGGRTRWEPASAVVFIGIAAGGGASAECCCDYLNFFTDHDSATAWAATHPEVPGQILTQTDAEELGRRLFQPLLTT